MTAGPQIQFSNVYPLLQICTPSLSGEFRTGWSKDYEQIAYGANRKVRVPVDDGSQLRLKDLPVNPELTEDIKDTFKCQQGIYLLTSTRFNIFYVGITEKGFVDGIFGGGRLAHHVRKLLAIKNGQATSHTEGWIPHAIERYSTLERLAQNGEREALSTEDLLNDMVVSFGVAKGAWSSKNHEGTVLDYFQNRLQDIRGSNFTCLNSQSTKRQPAQIIEPENLKSAINV